MRRALEFVICLPLIGACTSSPEEGTEQGPCYPNRTCNSGLTCLSHSCVRLPGSDVGSPDTRARPPDTRVRPPDGWVSSPDGLVKPPDLPISPPDQKPADAVDGILNGPSPTNASTHWNCAGPYTGCGQYAFYGSHTYHYRSSSTGPVKSCAWMKVGPAALVLDTACGSISSLSSIKGSLSQGQFTATPGTGAPLLFGIAGGNF